jgi:uncharacterized protein (TIGR02145 family)
LVTGVNSIDDGQSSDIKIYPNPMNDNSILQVYAPSTGSAIIKVIDMTGKLLAQTEGNLDKGLQEFQLSGIKSGAYIINVSGRGYQLSGKLLSNSKEGGTIRLEKISNNQAANSKTIVGDAKGVQATFDMEYSTGDRLKFTGVSGNYSTVIMDVPTSGKTITFNFIACTDADNNNYPIVKIGSLVWMAENLKTTKYNDGTAIPNITVDAAWTALITGAYCDYGNTPSNSTTYGRLYNWYAVDNNAPTKVASNGGKNVCPTGWHVPSDLEWSYLESYLRMMGYNWDSTTSYQNDKIAKSMASTSGWATSTTAGNVGNDQASNNKSGLTALPGGYRHSFIGAFSNIGNYCSWWSSTEHNITIVYYRYMLSSSSGLFRSTFNKSTGLSVRCLRDF